MEATFCLAVGVLGFGGFLWGSISNREVDGSTMKARVAIIDFRKDAPQGPPVEFRVTPEEITGELSKAGFALDSRDDFLPRQMFLIYRVS